MDGLTYTSRYRVEGMDCAGCAMKIDTAVKRLAGVEASRTQFATGTLTVDHAEQAVRAKVIESIESLGYKAQLLPDNSSEDVAEQPGTSDTESWWKTAAGKSVIGMALALAMAYGLSLIFPPYAPYLFIASMAIGFPPIAKRAFAAARTGSPFSIEMLMTIAVVGAVFIGASEEAATVVLLFQIGELMEGVAARKARSSITSLKSLVPEVAVVERDGATNTVQASTLAVDDVILARPGDRIPADGVILSGESAIDESSVTGESVPVRKMADASVFAGTVNGDGVLRIRVTARPTENTIAKIVKMVEEAQDAKAPTERFIERFSRYYTPVVVVMAVLVALSPPLAIGADWQTWIYRGLAILLIGCPCALVISTPAALAASLAAGARRGLLLKGGAVLERLRSATIACFDKTGTLTAGKPIVTDIIAFDASEKDVLRFAAALESESSHPLAAAINARATKDKADVPKAENASSIAGEGVIGTVEGKNIFLGSRAAASKRTSISDNAARQIDRLHDEGKSVSLVIVDKILIGALAMRDELRADAKAGILALAEIGIKAVMLTGDNRSTARAIGSELNIEVHAELLPEQKLKFVRTLKTEGKTVIKIGDGVNDAPALAEADIGIAMGGGTDVALDTADAAILHRRVTDVSAMIALSKRTMTNIHQNIAIALGLKSVFLITTMLGVTGLWPAILADTGATVLVTINALRLLSWPVAR